MDESIVPVEHILAMLLVVVVVVAVGSVTCATADDIVKCKCCQKCIYNNKKKLLY